MRKRDHLRHVCDREPESGKNGIFESGMPRRIEFTLTLKRVDESLSDMFGSLSDQLSNLQDSATSAIGNIKNTVGGLLQ